MTYRDKTLRCRDCGKDFEFTAREQEFYASKGLLNEPGRCPDCRTARRSGRSSGGDQGYGSRAPREMHSAVCASCGGEALVPFVPRTDKPVYCQACFEKMRERR